MQQKEHSLSFMRTGQGTGVFVLLYRSRTVSSVAAGVENRCGPGEILSPSCPLPAPGMVPSFTCPVR